MDVEMNSRHRDEHPLLDGPIVVKMSHAKSRDRHRHFSSLEHASLSAYWFGWSFLWMPLLVVIIPMQVARMAGEENKGTALSSTLVSGSFVAFFAAPICGSLSDSSRNAMGRRRPFMIVGTIISSVALTIMAAAPTIAWFNFGFLLVSLANNMVLAPYSALVPDVVPPNQRGTASGWLGGMSMLGNLSGGLISYHIEDLGIGGCYAVLMLVHAICMGITVHMTPEVPIREVVSPHGLRNRLRSFLKPLRSKDFRIVFFTRFLMQMGILTVQEYLQYYVQDAIESPYTLFGRVVATNAQKAVSILFLPMLLGAIGSSMGAGVLSDRWGGARKQIVYMSGTVMAIACVLFSVTRNFAFDMLLGLLFGLGFGAFSVMDWAMATDVLPNPDEFAKDMGLWSLALVLPQVIAAPISGNLLDYFQKVNPELNLGYSVIFLVAVLYFVVGTAFVKFIEGVH